jgi:hypothetical protein
MSGRGRIWEFYGFKSEHEGTVVQDWFNGLDMDAQDEIVNLVQHLSVVPGGQWTRPDYDPLEGEGGISELRPRDVRTLAGNAVYRIYGYRGCPNKRCYTFLHGTDKDVKNDVEGKAIAKGRLNQLLCGTGGEVHEFDFTAQSLEEIEKEQGGES